MSTNLGPLFIKGIDKNIHVTINAYEAGWKVIFHVEPTGMRYIDEQTWEGYPLPQSRLPGTVIASGQFNPSFNKHYVVLNVGLQDQFPNEDLRDDLYGVIKRVIPAKGGLFGRTFMDYLEIYCANLLGIIGFASGAPAGSPDGVALFSASHPISASQQSILWSNIPTVPVDLSIAGVQASETAMRLQKAPNNITIIQNEVDMCIYNPAEHYVAMQVYKGRWEVNTADRNENFITRDKVKLHSWPYWNKSGATGTNNGWMVRGREHYLNFFTRQGVESDTQSDINTNSQIIAATMRFAAGYTDPRGTWGSPGI